MENKKINLSINEGVAFYGHEASINYSPNQFIFDFRCITPRVDPRSNEGPIVNLVHNVVMVDPEHAKSFHELLGRLIEKYESDFGRIGSKTIEKKAKKAKEKEPNYFG